MPNAFSTFLFELLAGCVADLLSFIPLWTLQSPLCSLVYLVDEASASVQIARPTRTSHYYVLDLYLGGCESLGKYIIASEQLVRLQTVLAERRYLICDCTEADHEIWRSERSPQLHSFKSGRVGTEFSGRSIQDTAERESHEGDSGRAPRRLPHTSPITVSWRSRDALSTMWFLPTDIVWVLTVPPLDFGLS